MKWKDDGACVLVDETYREVNSVRFVQIRLIWWHVRYIEKGGHLFSTNFVEPTEPCPKNWVCS